MDIIPIIQYPVHFSHESDIFYLSKYNHPTMYSKTNLVLEELLYFIQCKYNLFIV